MTEESGTPPPHNPRPQDQNAFDAHVGDVRTAAPFALIVDDQQAVCQTIAIVLDGLGVESANCQTAKSAIDSLDRRRPEIIFLDMCLEESDAMDVIKGLGEKHYTGIVQLMSGGKLPLLEAVLRIAARNGLVLRPPLQKPFRAGAIRQVIIGAGLACAVPPTPTSSP
jgi:DNA-binding NtrC family response regulator